MFMVCALMFFSLQEIRMPSTFEAISFVRNLKEIFKKYIYVLFTTRNNSRFLIYHTTHNATTTSTTTEQLSLLILVLVISLLFLLLLSLRPIILVQRRNILWYLLVWFNTTQGQIQTLRASWTFLLRRLPNSENRRAEKINYFFNWSRFLQITIMSKK